MPALFSDLELKPVGLLEVKLVEARDLTNKDLVGKSDPFAVLYIRPLQDKMKKSKTIVSDAFIWLILLSDILIFILKGTSLYLFFCRIMIWTPSGMSTTNLWSRTHLPSAWLWKFMMMKDSRHLSLLAVLEWTCLIFSLEKSKKFGWTLSRTWKSSGIRNVAGRSVAALYWYMLQYLVGDITIQCDIVILSNGSANLTMLK